ncbi:hypothetical protein [Gulosibacter sp. ACHW.36C]|uniref:Uncharacterized protein n=1 Tax=Gulosibacter sediminis TaxID=1729695 RepID=A0ABY4MV20_9MICO|nr:hypothetical protein [Gulosibacter sediminis]UQN14268.1 hypothetical protein M3M28_09425 [Gulosibacter sediminis]
MFRKQANPFVRFGLSTLVIGIVLLALNIFNTARTVAEYPGIDFMDVFWVTEGTNGANNVRLMVQVWGPVILIPLGIILLIVAVVTRKGKQDAQQQPAAGQFGDQQAAPQYGAPQQSQQWQQQSQAAQATAAQASQWAPEQLQQAQEQALQAQAQAQQYGAQAGYNPAQPTQGDAAAPQYGQQAPHFGDGNATKQ